MTDISTWRTSVETYWASWRHWTSTCFVVVFIPLVIIVEPRWRCPNWKSQSHRHSTHRKTTRPVCYKNIRHNLEFIVVHYCDRIGTTSHCLEKIVLLDQTNKNQIIFFGSFWFLCKDFDRLPFPLHGRVLVQINNFHFAFLSFELIENSFRFLLISLRCWCWEKLDDVRAIVVGLNDLTIVVLSIQKAKESLTTEGWLGLLLNKNWCLENLFSFVWADERASERTNVVSSRFLCFVLSIM